MVHQLSFSWTETLPQNDFKAHGQSDPKSEIEVPVALKMDLKPVERVIPNLKQRYHWPHRMVLKSMDRFTLQRIQVVICHHKIKTEKVGGLKC